MDDLERKKLSWFTLAVMMLLAVFSVTALTASNDTESEDPNISGKVVIPPEGGGGGQESESAEVTAAIIPCKDMIDDGLLQSIKRRSKKAIDQGASYLIYDIDTYGGLVISADQISEYLILDAGKKAHTVAFVTTKAVSAGALISVACKDIVMVEDTIIGDCAPVTMGAEMKGPEREKAESFIRAIFSRSAKANGYPEALLRSMVSQRIEVFRVRNTETGEYEFFEKKNLPTDPNAWDLGDTKLIVSENEILTLTADKAEEYGIARTIVDDIDGMLDFFEKRDNVVFEGKPEVMEMLWSEQMVRWVNSPGVMGVLVLLAMLGGYIELSSPGLGLPGLVAVICIVVIVGSKYLVGLANWIEVALFVIGIVLILVEIFVIPGFGVAGITGIALMIAGGFGMLIKNEPGEIPWPSWETGGWDILLDRLAGVTVGIIGFVVAAVFLGRYLPKANIFRRLTLEPESRGGETSPVMTSMPEVKVSELSVGDVGVAVSTLRPAGQAQFDKKLADVVTEGEFIANGDSVMITQIHGNRVVVRKAN